MSRWLILLTAIVFLLTSPKISHAEDTQSFPNLDYMEILEVMVGRMVYGDFVDVYNHNGEGGDNYYINFEQYIKMVGFKIETTFPNENDEDYESFEADGFFLRLGNKFKLNNTHVTYIETTEAIPKQAIANDEGDLYIRIDLLAKWFPIDLVVENSILTLTPREKLPFQEKRERKKKRDNWFNKDPKPTYPNYDEPYGFLNNYPMTDLSFGTSYNSKENALKADYTSTITTDIYPLNFRFNLTGNEHNQLKGFKIFAERNVSEEDYLITRFQAGDISTSVRGLSRGVGGAGRGIYLSNQPHNKPSKFDSTDIKGYTQPKWEVEVYKNNQLLAFQEAGEDGFYEFNDIAIEYGENEIRTVKFGPHGEIETDTEKYYIDSALLPLDEFHYQFSINQPNSNLTFFPDPNHNETFLNFDAEYGLSDSTTLYYGTSYYQKDDIEENLFKAFGLTNVYAQYISRIDFLFDVINNNARQKFSLITNIGSTSLRFNQSLWQDDSNKLSKTELTLSGGFDSFISNKDTVSYNISNALEIDDDYNWKALIKSRIGTNLVGTNFTNTNNLNLTPFSTSLGGSLALRKRLTDDSLRLGIGYSIMPELSIDSIGLTWQHYYSSILNTRMDINLSPNAKSLNLSGGINYTHKYFNLGINGNIDDELNFGIGANISFSLYHDKINNKPIITRDAIASSGLILASAYLDENINQEREEKEEIFADIAFIKGGGVHKTNASGVAQIIGGGRANIILDETTLPDPMMTPEYKGFNVGTRPGVITMLEFPVVETSEIDGEVIVIETSCEIDKKTDEEICETEEKAIGGIRIQLIKKDGSVVKTITGEYDGFYIMDKVKPGDYFLTLHQEDLKKIGCRMKENVPISVAKGSDSYTETNIYMIKD